MAAVGHQVRCCGKGAGNFDQIDVKVVGQYNEWHYYHPQDGGQVNTHPEHCGGPSFSAPFAGFDQGIDSHGHDNEPLLKMYLLM